MSELTFGILGALGSAVTWASISILAQDLAGRFTPAGINAFRSTVGGLAVLLGAVAAGLGGEIIRMPLWAALMLWASILVGYAGGDTLFFEGMRRLGVTRAHTLSMVHPLLSTVVGAWLLHEPVTPLRGVGIGLVLTGISLIVVTGAEAGPEQPGLRWQGVRFVLGAAVAWSAASVMLKAPLQVTSAATATGVRHPVAGLALWLTPWSRGTWAAVRQSGRRDARLLAAICVLSAVSPLLFTAGIKYGGVAIGTVLSTTSPLFTIPLEIVVLKRRPTARTIAGAVITVVGIVLMG
ncbi:MAG: DMT family transporter [Candidatus Methylomirabilales bacterium]